MNELNEKLGKWAGFEKFGWCNWDMWAKPDEAIPESWTLQDLFPNSFALPDFTNSLDACFKHLVPKLEAYFITNRDKPHATVELNGKAKRVYNENLALALCLAIELMVSNTPLIHPICTFKDAEGA